MATAPSADETERLGVSDLLEVVEALLDAKDKAYEFGLALKLPPGEVRSICGRYHDPQQCLTALMEYYLKQVNPIPNWRAIAGALRSPVVNLPRLAERVEATKLTTTAATAPTTGNDTLSGLPPNPISSPPTADRAETTESEKEVKNKEEWLSQFVVSADDGTMTPTYITTKINEFEERFNQLKWDTREGLKQSKVPVVKVVDALADLPADDVPEHQFLDSALRDLYDEVNYNKLFAELRKHMNYLSYGLIDYLVGKFKLGIKDEMETYKADLKQFREIVPLESFCKTRTKRRNKPSEEFVEMVAEFKWPKNVTLEVVEQFRKEYGFHYKLLDVAMRVADILFGSFIVIWYIPRSIAEKLQNNVPRDILCKYSATKLEIDGRCVFKEQLSPDESDKKMKQKTMVYAGLNTNDEKSYKDKESLSDFGGTSSLHEFKWLVLKISTQLSREDVRMMSYICDVPRHDSLTGLEVLEYLERVGYFSYSNVEPLQILLGDISRYDQAILVMDFIVKESMRARFKRSTRPRSLSAPTSKVLSKEDTRVIRYIDRVPAQLPHTDEAPQPHVLKHIKSSPSSPHSPLHSPPQSTSHYTVPEPFHVPPAEYTQQSPSPPPLPIRRNRPPSSGSQVQSPPPPLTPPLLNSPLSPPLPLTLFSSNSPPPPPIALPVSLDKHPSQKPLSSEMPSHSTFPRESSQTTPSQTDFEDVTGDSGVGTGTGSTKYGTWEEWKQAIRNLPKPPLPLRPRNRVETMVMEEEEEERDWTGDSGMGTGSGSAECGTVEEWKSVMKIPPPPIPEKPRRYRTHQKDAPNEDGEEEEENHYATLMMSDDPEDCVAREYRAFVVEFAINLKVDDIHQIAYIWLRDKIDISIYEPSSEKRASALELFSVLESRGLFCATEPRGLLKISKSINRTDLVEKVKEFMKKIGKINRKVTKKKKKTSTSDDKEKLEQAYEMMISQSMKHERCIRELQTVLQKPDYTTEAGVAVVQKSEKLAHEYVSEMSQVRNDLGFRSRASSTTSSSSDSSTESHRRKSDETKVLSPIPEQHDGYEPVAAPTPPIDSEETPRNSPAVFRQKSPEKRKKPPIKPRSSSLKRRTVSTASEESTKENASFVVGTVSSLCLSGNRLFTYDTQLPHSPLTVKSTEELKEEEDDKTGDSGVGTGSGGGYECLEEWKANPTPALDNQEPTEYAALTPSTMDPVHSYKNIKSGQPYD